MGAARVPAGGRHCSHCATKGSRPGASVWLEFEMGIWGIISAVPILHSVFRAPFSEIGAAMLRCPLAVMGGCFQRHLNESHVALWRMLLRALSAAGAHREMVSVCGTCLWPHKCFNCYEHFFRLCFDFFFNCLSTSCTDALCCSSCGRGCGIHLENLLVELLHSLFFASHNVSFMHVIALSQLL